VSSPTSFPPDLAMPFGALGSVHVSGEDWPAAAEAFAEGIRTLTPYFLRIPAAFGDLMRILVEMYQNACNEGGITIDEALLAPLLPYLRPPEEGEG